MTRGGLEVRRVTSEIESFIKIQQINKEEVNKEKEEDLEHNRYNPQDLARLSREKIFKKKKHKKKTEVRNFINKMN